MTPGRRQDRIHPTARLGVLKEVVRYPEHQSMPILREIYMIGLPHFRIELQEPTTSTSELSGNAVNERRPGFERRSSPICKGLPVYVASNSFGETLRFDQSVRRPGLA